MRHLIAAAVLVIIALAVTMGAATVLQNMANSRAPQSDEYVPPALASPGGRSKTGETGRSLMVSRRMNDENNERNELNNE